MPQNACTPVIGGDLNDYEGIGVSANVTEVEQVQEQDTLKHVKEELQNTRQSTNIIPRFEMGYFDIEKEFTECIQNVDEKERKSIAKMIIKVLNKRNALKNVNNSIDLNEVEKWIDSAEFISGNKKKKSKKEDKQRRENVVKLYTMLVLILGDDVCCPILVV